VSPHPPLRNNAAGSLRSGGVLPPGSPTLTVDGVFLDPPYEFEGIEDILSALEPWLTDGAWVVIERSTRSRAPAWPAGFEPWEDKKYGDTVVYSATWSPKGSQPPSED